MKIKDFFSEMVGRSADKSVEPLQDSSKESDKQKKTNINNIIKSNKSMDHIKNLEFEGKEYNILSRITYQDVRDAIDEIGYSSKGVKEKQYVGLTVSGKDWQIDLIVHFALEENWLKMYSFADYKNSDIHLGDGNLPIKGMDLYIKLNEYNRTTRYATAYLEDNVVFLEKNIYANARVVEGDNISYLPLPLSQEYLLRCLDAFIDVSAHFFNSFLLENLQEKDA